MTDLDLILQAAAHEADTKRAFGESYNSTVLTAQARELQDAVERVRRLRRNEPIPRDPSGFEQLKATIARDGEYVTTENCNLFDPYYAYRCGHIGLKNPRRRGHLVFGDVVVVSNDGIRMVLEEVEVGKLQAWADNGIARAD